MEDRCKELDFSLVTTTAASTSSFLGASADTLTKWSNFKLELETAIKYAEVVSDLLAYTTVAVEDVSNSDFHKSLVEELGAAQRRTKDLVYL